MQIYILVDNVNSYTYIMLWMRRFVSMYECLLLFYMFIA